MGEDEICVFALLMCCVCYGFLFVIRFLFVITTQMRTTVAIEHDWLRGHKLGAKLCLQMGEASLIV